MFSTANVLRYTVYPCYQQADHSTFLPQIDVLSSNNQVLCIAIVKIFSDVTRKSHEQKLITKEHKAI